MGIITTGNHPKALWPGVEAWWGLKYKEQPKFWEKMFDESKSSKKYEENVEATGFGLAAVKSEGQSVSYDTHSQGPTTRYTHVTYALGFIVTREEMDDNQYEELARGRTTALAFSMATTKNIVAANVFNRAFNSAYAGGDGKELLATDHPTLDGTQSNELSTPADLSEAALEDLVIQISLAKNSRGLPIVLQPKALMVHPSNMFEAHRILKSQLQSGTANNDANALKDMGLFSEVMSNPYFTDEDAFFIKTNAPEGLKWFERRKIEFTKDNDFDTENAKAKSTNRYSFGHTDWRGVYGSPGA